MTYVPIQFQAYIAPAEMIRLFFELLRRVRKIVGSTTWKHAGAREYRFLFGDVAFDDFISFDNRSVALLLLESGHEWHRRIPISSDDVARGNIERHERLQEYLTLSNTVQVTD